MPNIWHSKLNAIIELNLNQTQLDWVWLSSAIEWKRMHTEYNTRSKIELNQMFDFQILDFCKTGFKDKYF